MIKSFYEFINRIFASVLLLFSEWYNYFRRAIRYYLPEESVLLYDNKTKKFTDFYYRFQLVKFIYKIADYFNVDGSKGHLVIHDKISHKKAIIDDDNVCLISLVNKSRDLLHHKKEMLALMVMKLEFNKGDETICIKEIFKNYLHIKEHQNTLHNIFLFNNIEYTDEDEINIKFFKNGKQQERTIKMGDYKDRHIKDLFED